MSLQHRQLTFGEGLPQSPPKSKPKNVYFCLLFVWFSVPPIVLLTKKSKPPQKVNKTKFTFLLAPSEAKAGKHTFEGCKALARVAKPFYFFTVQAG